MLIFIWKRLYDFSFTKILVVPGQLYDFTTIVVKLYKQPHPKPTIRHGPFDILGGPGIFWKKISLL